MQKNFKNFKAHVSKSALEMTVKPSLPEILKIPSTITVMKGAIRKNYSNLKLTNSNEIY
jgi:hypothetical protein